MASGRIKGITIEIGGDTVGLQNALRDVNKRTKEVQSELKDVERLLKFDPNNVEILAQKQELLTRSIQETTTKLDQLKQAESQVQAQFQRGDISQEQYRGFRRELQQTEQQLQGYQAALQDMQTEQQQIERKTRDLSTVFEATGTSVEDYVNVIGQRLVRAIQNGTATSRDLEYAFQRIGRQAIGSNGDIERLRTTLGTVDSGASIQNIRRDMQQLRDETNQATESVGKLGSALETAAGAALAGGGAAGAVQQSLDLASLDTKIDITFEVPEESKESIKEAVMGIQAYGLEGEEALEGVRRQWALNKNESDEVNNTIAKGAAAIAKNFAGVDFIELIQETNEIGAALKISNQDALALVDSLLKAGFPPEQLDTIAEYGTQMQLAGFNAAEIQAIFEAGIDTKTWNIDNLNDGVKEARIQMATFGLEVPKAMKPLIKEAGISVKKFQEWGKAVAAGGSEGSKAMGEVSTWLDSIDNKELKNELATKVFGTKWEDQGENMISVFKGVSDASDQTNENLNGLYSTLGKTNADPMVELQQAITNVKVALAPLLTLIAELVVKFSTWVSENPKIAAAIAGIVSAIGILAGALIALYPIFGVLQKVFPYLLKILPHIGRALTALSGPIGWIITLITILAIAIYKNWDEIWAKTQEVWGNVRDWLASCWESIKEGVSIAWTAIKEFFVTWWDELLAFITGPIGMLVYLIFHNWETIKTTTIEVWNGIKSFFSTLWEGIKTIFNGVITSVVNLVKTKWENIKSNTSTIFNNVRTLISGIWNGIKTFFSTTIENIVSTVKSKFESIKDSIQSKMEAARDIVQEIIDKIKGFFDLDLYDSGKAIIQSAIDGIMSMKRTIESKVEDLVGGVRDFWPFSPAKRGPLSDIDKMDFAGPIGDSIEKARNPLESAMEHLAGRVSHQMNGMTQVEHQRASTSQTRTPAHTVNNYNDGLLRGAIFNIREEADIKKIAVELDKLMKKNARGTGVIIT